MPVKSTYLAYALLAVVVLCSMVFYIASIAQALDTMRHYNERARPPFSFSSDPRVLVRPLTEARQAGIQAEDRVLSVDGVPFTGVEPLIRQSFLAHPGQRVMVTYQTPQGQVRSAPVVLAHIRGEPQGRPNWIIVIVLVILFPALCLLLGYWVVLARPTSREAWFFLGVMNFIPAFSTRVPYFPGPLAPFTMFWQMISGTGLFLSLLLLGVYFPVRSRIDIRHPWIKWLVILPQLAVLPVIFLLHYGQLYHSAETQPYLGVANPLDTADSTLAALSLFIFLAATVRKLFSSSNPDALRRLGVIAAGSVAGLGPVLVLIITALVRQRPFPETAPPWITLTVAFLFTLFPLSLAYTVIVQRALDVRIILRQGTRYALARGTLWVLQFAVFVYLGFRLFRFGHEPGHRLIHLIAPMAFVLSVLFLRLRIARPLSLWIDRRFFREAYSVEQVLSELSEQARTFTDTEPLLHTILERIGDTLHVERISVLLRQGPIFHLQHAHGLAHGVNVVLPANSHTIRTLTRNRGPALVYPERPEPWLALASPSELEALQELQAELLLPLPGRSSLIGVMALGRKRSEAPYSRSDRQLLQSVALQTGLAIENSALIHHLSEEAAARERINREIEIAREVQERLFPQVYPEVRGVEFAGFCRTAQEVGGDYYDFIALENGRLGIAVGDVSGKGISAALLMASIRAALRGMTLSGNLDLPRIMRNMNQIIYDGSASNRFATFFFGEYDPVTRTLDYVNAGHNSPALLRPAASDPESDPESNPVTCSPESPCTVQRLDIGGPVIGILEKVEYEQGRLQLQPGDVFIAFTDGISEAMNAALEEWGEDKLIASAQSCTRQPAADIVSCLIKDADTFVADATQNDDLTMVVLKVLWGPK